MRIEPLLHPSFKHIMPVKIPRYQKYPYGDSAPIYAGKLALTGLLRTGQLINEQLFTVNFCELCNFAC